MQETGMKKRKLPFDRKIGITIGGMLLLGILFLTASAAINKIAERACFVMLEDVADQFAMEVKQYVESDREQLEVVADILGRYESLTSPQVQSHLLSFRQRGSISTVGILAENNHSVFYGKRYMGPESELEFAKEVQRAPYISRVQSGEEREGKYFFQAVPIKSGGTVKGILYGFVELEDLPHIYSNLAFDGKAQCYIVDGETGDFIMDTWHDKAGNIKGDGMSSRKPKRGFEKSDVSGDLLEGRKGYAAFLSQSAGEYFYTSYTPVGVERWMAMITVPESLAFADAARISLIINALATADIVILLCYFMWILKESRRDMAVKEKELAKVRYASEVQLILFDAYKNEKRIVRALKQVAEMLRADTAFLISLENETIKATYCWSNKEEGRFPEEKQPFLTVFPHTGRQLLRGESVLICRREEQTASGEIQEWEKAENLMIVPALDYDGGLAGVLGVFGKREQEKDISLLECVVRDFLMALSHIGSYQIVQKMGKTDSLTGLQNRHSYEQKLEELEKEERGLCCIYMDANGLHSINNVLGHTAGDSMLIYIGRTMQECLGKENVFRIGGDEFIAFLQDISSGELKSKLKKLEGHLKLQNYYVSLGVAWKTDGMAVSDTIKAAENAMYNAKKEYYREKKDEAQIRGMNVKLEQILAEKQDNDNFLSLISSYFYGVYIVNLKTKDMRVIYAPDFFQPMLEHWGNSFHLALTEYGETFLEERYLQGFVEAIDYENVHRELQQKKKLEYHYYRKDGVQIMFRVLPSPSYAEECPETFWMFEECH